MAIYGTDQCRLGAVYLTMKKVISFLLILVAVSVAAFQIYDTETDTSFEVKSHAAKLQGNILTHCEGSVSLIDQSGDIAQTPLLSVTEGTLYRVTGLLLVMTPADSGTIEVAFQWNDSLGVTGVSSGQFPADASGRNVIGPFVMNITSAESILYNVDFDGTAGALNYRVQLVAERIQ